MQLSMCIIRPYQFLCSIYLEETPKKLQVRSFKLRLKTFHFGLDFLKLDVKLLINILHSTVTFTVLLYLVYIYIFELPCC